MRILFIRHGDPDYVNDTLTEKGRREAAALAERAAALDLGTCFVSPPRESAGNGSLQPGKTREDGSDPGLAPGVPGADRPEPGGAFKGSLSER